MRSSTGPKGTPSSTSLAMHNGIASDPQGQQAYLQLAMPSIHTVAPPTLTERYTTATYGTTNWMSVKASPSTFKSGDGSWEYQGGSPPTSAASTYSAYPGQPSKTCWSTSVSGDSSIEKDMSWSGYEAPPIRSRSYSSYSMTSQQAHYAPASCRPYVSPLVTTIPSIETIPGSMDHHVAGAVASPGYQTWPQYQYARPGESYGHGMANRHPTTLMPRPRNALHMSPACTKPKSSLPGVPMHVSDSLVTHVVARMQKIQ
jgi:hypothetical protein